MKALAIAIIWASYCVAVYGVDKVRKGCTPFKTIAWPVGAATTGDISVSCSGGSSSSPATANESVGGGGSPNAEGVPSPNNIGGRNDTGGWPGSTPQQGAYTGGAAGALRRQQRGAAQQPPGSGGTVRPGFGVSAIPPPGFGQG